jgi:hypothetical protein
MRGLILRHPCRTSVVVDVELVVRIDRVFSILLSGDQTPDNPSRAIRIVANRVKPSRVGTCLIRVAIGQSIAKFFEQDRLVNAERHPTVAGYLVVELIRGDAEVLWVAVSRNKIDSGASKIG